MFCRCYVWTVSVFMATLVRDAVVAKHLDRPSGQVRSITHTNKCDYIGNVVIRHEWFIGGCIWIPRLNLIQGNG